MPRKTQEEMRQDFKEDPNTEAQAHAQTQQPQTEIVEVPINLELLNNKINFIISELAQIKNFLASKKN